MKILKLFSIFFRIGLFTIGGGYVILPVIEKEIVRKRRWISEEDFQQYITLVQGAPGPLTINCATLVGYRIAGVKGALASMLGSSLPSFLVITAIAVLFADFGDNIYLQRFFAGVRPAVVALILYYGIHMFQKSRWSNFRLILLTVYLAVFIILRPNPIILILTGIGIGLAVSLKR